MEEETLKIINKKIIELLKTNSPMELEKATELIKAIIPINIMSRD